MRHPKSLAVSYKLLIINISILSQQKSDEVVRTIHSTRMRIVIGGDSCSSVEEKRCWKRTKIGYTILNTLLSKLEFITDWCASSLWTTAGQYELRTKTLGDCQAILKSIRGGRNAIQKEAFCKYKRKIRASTMSTFCSKSNLVLKNAYFLTFHK